MKKHKKRGRKKGSRNTYSKDMVASYLVEMPLTCCKCGRVLLVTTNKAKVDEVYTREVKKNWCCKLGKCKKEVTDEKI